MAAKRTVSTAPHWCPACEELVHLVAVYECNNCSNESEERRCADCHKFSSRRDEDGCENCMAECEEVEVVTDHDGTLIRAEDFDAATLLRERNAATEAAHKVEQAATAKKKTEQAYAGATAKPWSEIKVGDEVLAFNRDGSLDSMMGNHTILSLQVVGADHADKRLEAGQIIAHTQRFGVALELHNPTDTAYVVNDPQNSEVEPPASKRYAVGTVDFASGGSIKVINADMGIDSHNGTFVPVGIIVGRSSASSGGYTGIGSFTDPAEADAFAAAARVAAVMLSDSGAEDEDFPLILDAKEHTFPSSPTRYVGFGLGMDDFNEKKIIEVRTGNDKRGGMTFSVHYPSVLLNIATAADHRRRARKPGSNDRPTASRAAAVVTSAKWVAGSREPTVRSCTTTASTYRRHRCYRWECPAVAARPHGNRGPNWSTFHR
jgi:hypothetical protein